MTYMTPNQLAKRWRVSPDKVAAWIRSGELRALNVASAGSTRPRWRIPPEAVQAFEAARSCHRQAPPPKRRKRDEQVTAYF